MPCMNDSNGHNLNRSLTIVQVISLQEKVSRGGLDLFARPSDNAAWLKTVITTEAVVSHIDLQKKLENIKNEMAKMHSNTISRRLISWTNLPLILRPR